MTRPDTFTMPNIQDFTFDLSGMTIFSQLDLANAYYNVGVHPKDVHKTCIRTNIMTFEYLVLPFGLSNSAASYFTKKNIYVYMDDIIVFSKDVPTHERTLRYLPA